MKYLVVIISLAFTSFGFSQEVKKTMTSKILTSAICGDCEERIEGSLNYMKGIVFAELDLDTKVVTVKYKTKKVSLKEVKKAITEIGYDADDMKANAKALNALPSCCKPNGKSCPPKKKN
ncbi:MAG: cation transporter [Crocinitomicaceae bacterium]|nr:cation transporter [Crocinitomicaceae bacterium]